jgi:hypothetical protein
MKRTTTKPLRDFMTTLLVSNNIQEVRSYCDGAYDSDDDVNEDTVVDRSDSIYHTLAIVNMVSQLLDEEDPFLLPPLPHPQISTSGSPSQQGSQEAQDPLFEDEDGDSDSLPSLDDCWSTIGDAEEDDEDLSLRTLKIVVDNAKLSVPSAIARTHCSCHCRNDDSLYSVIIRSHSVPSPTPSADHLLKLPHQRSIKFCRWQSPPSRASCPVVSGDKMSLPRSPRTCCVCNVSCRGTTFRWTSPPGLSRQDESPILPRKISSSPRSHMSRGTLLRADARPAVKSTDDDSPGKGDQGESLVDMIQMLSVRAALALTNQNTSFGHDL